MVNHLQLGVDPRGPIDAPVGRVDLLDQTGQVPVFKLPAAGRAPRPGVVGRSVDPESLGQDAHRVVHLLSVDESERPSSPRIVFLSEEADRFFQDLTLHPEAFVLLADNLELLFFVGAQAALFPGSRRRRLSSF